MRRIIRSRTVAAPAPMERLSRTPSRLIFPLDPVTNRCVPAPQVSAGAEVAAGQVLASCPEISVHSPVAAKVLESDRGRMVLSCVGEPGANFPQSAAIPLPKSARELAEFAAGMGLAGMGGSMFPASIKFRASEGAGTVVMNAVECEPGIEIDIALLFHDTRTVLAGLDALCAALGAKRRVVAIRKSSLGVIGEAVKSAGMEVMAVPDRYPAGAEKLIVGWLEGRVPPAGVLPFHLGYLVTSVASVWAVGRRVSRGVPSTERPLTLIAPGREAKNVIVPVGAPAGHVLDDSGVRYDSSIHVLVAGGRMMGRAIGPDDPVTKGTNALFVVEAGGRLANEALPCVLCGSCFDACPLKLHPIGMADRIRAGRKSRALSAQLDECFLCGACSAVCPADIPLVQFFAEGKRWLKEAK